MTFIIIITIIWTWKSLLSMDKPKKAIYIIVGIVIIYLITNIIFQFSKNGVEYTDLNMYNSIRNILVLVFAGINGVILMPQIAKIIELKKEGTNVNRRIVILLIIFIICVIFESGYMKDTQEGILKIYETLKE